MTPTFTTENNRVWINTDAGSVPMTAEAVDRLLDAYDEAGAKSWFNALYDAAQQTDWFIPRCTSLRQGRAA